MTVNKGMMSAEAYFSRISQPQIPRSMFPRNRNVLTTMVKNKLMVLHHDEILPADTINLDLRMFGRLLTPLKPFFDNLYVDIHVFFIPNRQIFDKWENLQGEQEDPEASPQPEYTVPQMEFDFGHSGGTHGIIPHSLAACFGLPLITSTMTTPLNTTVSALPFRAYRKVYDDYYRDQNFEKKTLTNISQTNDKYIADKYYELYGRWKSNDYFTSCLPQPQKGNEVVMNIGGIAPVTGNINVTGNVLTGITANYPIHRGTTAAQSPMYATPAGTANQTYTTTLSNGNISATATHTLTANLASASGISINDFRIAATMQQFLERDMRSGTRYIESLYVRFGVLADGYRLQRPEFLGSTRVDINLVPIAQTSESAGTPQANLAAMGTLSSRGQLRVIKSFTEHGQLLVIGSLIADLNYQQGIERKWFRKSKFDFYDPLFANVGEQAVLNREIFFTDTANDAQAFGYNEAWADYRYQKNMILNLMNSNAPTPIDMWHVAEDYLTTPVLGKTFLQYNTPVERVVAVQDEPPIELHMYLKNKHARALPIRSIPGIRRI